MSPTVNNFGSIARTVDGRDPAVFKTHGSRCQVVTENHGRTLDHDCRIVPHHPTHKKKRYINRFTTIASNSPLLSSRCNKFEKICPSGAEERADHWSKTASAGKSPQKIVQRDRILP
ncbi:hypothetical protein [Rhizobium sp. LCM 4573]|uniref:hypothetical protein n=1 Tax=Rhizobium sp. LCM 4573 TaxID=1848291 RepID=UPI001FCD49ED|nr:hypothetical protein [Rhizobium sp. LCM 4573]